MIQPEDKKRKDDPAARSKPARTAIAQRQLGQFSALTRSFVYLNDHKSDAIGAVASMILAATASLLIPQLYRKAIDNGIANKQGLVVAIIATFIFLAALGRALFTFLQGYLAERASQSVAEELRVALYSHFHRLSFTFSNVMHTGQILSRLTRDVEQVRGFTGGGAVRLSGAIILFLGCLTLLIQINWHLTLVTLATIPLSFVVLMRIGKKVGPIFGQMQQTVGRLAMILQESLTGMRVIRGFCREQFELDKFRSINKSWLERNSEFLDTFTNNFPLALLFGNLATLTIIWYGGLESIGGRLSLGELIAFYSYLSFLHYTTIAMSFEATYVLGAASASRRVFEILDAPLEVQEAEDAESLDEIEGRVEFKDVHFRYPGGLRETLRGVSFTAEPGQRVALIGTTGAGKSTIINLIPRLFDITSGEILLDGKDIRKLSLSSLRSRVGLALQDPLLFSGSIHENISYGKPRASHQEIESAARAADIHEFISKLPMGYETHLGTGGVNLSGGQRQRIAIARAILINPRLLILDDSTSAVDTETETSILESIDYLMRESGRTVFVIAHRISTIRDADLILVLDDGQIIAQGTHETLVRESPLYCDILGSQVLTPALKAAEAKEEPKKGAPK